MTVSLTHMSNATQLHDKSVCAIYKNICFLKQITYQKQISLNNLIVGQLFEIIIICWGESISLKKKRLST